MMARAQRLRTPTPAGQGPLELDEVAPAVPAGGEIAVDVSACGVCRTDLQLVEGDLPARRLPIVPGHQVVGRVRAVGSGVTEWSVGELEYRRRPAG